MFHAQNIDWPAGLITFTVDQPGKKRVGSTTYLVHQTGWYEETKFLPIRIIQQYYLCVLCLETCVPQEAVKGVFLIFLPQQLRKKYIEIILLYFESRLYHKVGNSRCAPTCGKCRHLR